MKAVNITRNRVIADDIAVADTFPTRMKGLLGRKALARGEGLWIKPCSSVHTFGMKFPIDVLFLDRKSRVTAIERNLPPNRIASRFTPGGTVLEVAAGTLDETAAALSDVIAIH